MMLVASVTQFFIYCLFSEMILTKNFDVSQALYCSKWYDIRNIADRKVMLLILINAQKPIGYSAGGIMKLGMGAFADVILWLYFLESYKSLCLLRFPRQATEFVHFCRILCNTYSTKCLYLFSDFSSVLNSNIR